MNTTHTYEYKLSNRPVFDISELPTDINYYLDRLTPLQLAKMFNNIVAQAFDDNSMALLQMAELVSQAGIRNCGEEDFYTHVKEQTQA